jgi:hypothetical protein
MPKHRQQLRIDQAALDTTAAAAVGVSIDFIASPTPPALNAIEAPYGLSLSTTLANSAVTPSAYISATWTPPDNVDTETISYIIQWSTDSTFATNTTGQPAPQASATISGLKCSTLYYVRVQAVYNAVYSPWSTAASITTAADTTPPAAPTAQAASFAGVGDLVITWTNPTSANFREVEIGIYSNSSKTITYATLYDATQRVIWTAAQNLNATAQAGDPSIYVELRSRSWGGIFSSAVNTGTITKAAPTAPTVTVDFTGAQAIYTITPPADAAGLSFVADTSVTARKIGVVNRLAYTFDQNRLDHSGTADPVLAYSFTAIDGINQSSTATSGTATNAAPSAPTVTLTGGFSQLVAQVTSAPAADFLAYEYVWKRDGSTVRTLESAASEQQYEIGVAADSGTHSWTVVVRQKDLFAQYSSTTTSSAVVLDALTIDYLRANANYTDSIGSSAAALNDMKDDDTSGGGVSYAA